jgi:kynurenine formamidase
MRFHELSMPLDWQWMPDEVLPTAVHFLLPPRSHADKGIILGLESGTSLMMPAQFAAFRRTMRLHEVPPEKLVLRPAVLADVPKGPREAISPADVDRAIESVDLGPGDGLLIRTGWGDGAPRERGSDEYLVDTPYLTPEAARTLGKAMANRGSDLLLLDTALVGYPDKHLIPEWVSMLPRPLPWPSEGARAYLQGYLEREVNEDWAADYALAEAGVTVVKRLVNCRAIQGPRVRLVLAPLHLVRGVGSPCRVVAVEVGEA